MSVFHWI